MHPLPGPTSNETDPGHTADTCHRIFEGRSQGMLVAGANGRILRASSSLEDLFGYARGTLSGRRTASLLPRRLRRAHLEVSAKPSAPQADRAWGVDDGLLGIRRDGSEFSIDVATVCVQLGGTALVFATIHDRTAQNTALDTLFDELERTRVMLRSIGDGVLSTDIDGRVTFLNPVSERLTGYSCAQARGRPVTEVFSIVDEVTRSTRSSPVAASMLLDRTLCLPPGTVLVRQDGSEIAIED